MENQKKKWPVFPIVGRALYPRIVTPSAFDGEGAEKYSMILLIPKDNKAIEPYVKSLAGFCKEEFSKGRIPANKRPFFDGDNYNEMAAISDASLGDDNSQSSQRKEYAGNYVLKTGLAATQKNGREQKPNLVNKVGSKITSEGVIYGGCWVSMTVASGGFYDHPKWGPMMQFQINTVKFEGHDTPLGTSSEGFAPVVPEIAGSFGSAAPTFDDSDFGPGDDDENPF